MVDPYAGIQVEVEARPVEADRSRNRYGQGEYTDRCGNRAADIIFFHGSS
jgi:hypothetical protein